MVKKSTFCKLLYHRKTCKRSLWTPPYLVENIDRLGVLMFQTSDNCQLLRRVLWINAELTFVWSLKHKNTQSSYIFNRENPQNSEKQNGPRRGLDFIALAQGKVGIFSPKPIPSLGTFANEKVGKRKTKPTFVVSVSNWQLPIYYLYGLSFFKLFYQIPREGIGSWFRSSYLALEVHLRSTEFHKVFSTGPPKVY